jgi:purine catabolism regulator
MMEVERPPDHVRGTAALALERRRTIQATSAFQRELLVQMDGHGLSGVAELLQRRSGCPVVVLDGAAKVLARAGVPASDRGAVRRLRSGLTDTSHGVATWTQGRWSVTIAPDGPVLGWLCALDELGEVEGDVCSVLEQAATIFTFEFLRIEHVSALPGATPRELADKMINDPTSKSVVSLANILGYELDRLHRVLAVRGPEGDDRIEHVEQTLRSLGIAAPLVSAMAEHLHLIVPVEDHPLLNEDPASAARLATALLNALGPETQIGIGRPHDRVALMRSVEEADFCLDLMQALGKGGHITSFDQLGFWQLLLEPPTIRKLREIVDEWIGPLVAHDESQGSELVKTLTVYLGKACSNEAAAAALFIHRNTLRYRLSKISQITGRHVTDPDQRFNLELACRAWQVVRYLDRSPLPDQAVANPPGNGSGRSSALDNAAAVGVGWVQRVGPLPPATSRLAPVLRGSTTK